MADWTLKPGDWCHIDVLSASPSRAKEFYETVFGWQIAAYPEGEMLGVKTSENGIESAIGGLAQATGKLPPAPNGVVPFILAPDMDATLAAIERAGGQVLIRTTDVFGYGDFAHFRDPDGNVIGLWRDAPGGDDG
jgi:predicted enzyme related to lactoylglutathione lyase